MPTPKLSPAQIKVLRAMAGGEGIWWGQGDKPYAFLEDSGKTVSLATAVNLNQMGYIQDADANCGEFDFYYEITEAGRAALKTLPKTPTA